MGLRTASTSRVRRLTTMTAAGDKSRQLMVTATRTEHRGDVDDGAAAAAAGNGGSPFELPFAPPFSVKPDRGNILLLDEPFSGLDAFARQAFEEIWKNSASNVLRLVSCHPDYDSMAMPSALMIDGDRARHFKGADQTWSGLKALMN